MSQKDCGFKFSTCRSACFLAMKIQDSWNGQICGSFLQRTLKAGINSVASFQLGIPCPHRQASAHPWAQFHLFFSHLSDHLPLSTGWHPADIHTSHRPPPPTALALALWAISAHPSPRPAQQDQSGKKQMWNSSQKAAGRPDWPPQSCRNDIPTVLILLQRCSHACAREGKVKEITDVWDS